MVAERPAGFRAISAWTGWTPIAAATGGSVGRPDATQHADLLAETEVAYFEILNAPRSTGGSPRQHID